MTARGVQELELNREVTARLLLVKKALRPYRNKAGHYLTVTLADKTGSIDGVMWDAGEKDYQALAGAKVVEVKGLVQEFNGELQLNIFSLQNLEGDFDPGDFLPQVPGYEGVKEAFLGRLARLREESPRPLALLVEEVFAGDFLRRFLQAPAASRYHHAYLGGLMEHTLRVMDNAAALAQNYPGVDKDLAAVGALFHDIGKVEELSWGTGIDYSVEGTLVGHILLGAARLREAAAALKARGEEIPSETLNLLLHFIASHHGIHEWGSPQQPKVLEALIIHHADVVDAEAFKFLQVQGEKGTCVYSDLLKRRVYLSGGR